MHTAAAKSTETHTVHTTHRSHAATITETHVYEDTCTQRQIQVHECTNTVTAIEIHFRSRYIPKH